MQISIFKEDNKLFYEKSIERLKFAYEICKSREQEKLYVCYSGGKDSIVLARLCEIANIPHELHYNITGIDPPELYEIIGTSKSNKILFNDNLEERQSFESCITQRKTVVNPILEEELND